MNKPTYTKEQKKAVLIYSGELALFSIIFLVIGLLLILQVIQVSDWKKYAFTYVTLIGGLWPIADFIWTLVSKKHRSHNSLVDKCLALPVPCCLIPLDIWILVNNIDKVDTNVFRFGISIPLIYFALVYAFEAIYHYFKPIPLLLEDDENDVKENQSSVAKEETHISENEENSSSDDNQK